jgi:hypothetical protein
MVGTSPAARRRLRRDGSDRDAGLDQRGRGPNTAEHLRWAVLGMTFEAKG